MEGGRSAIGSSRQRPEEKLQVEMVRFLRAVLPREAVLLHVPNGGWRTHGEAARLKAMGVMAGFPDLAVIWDGRIFGIELKAARGRLSPEQHQAHLSLRAAGMAVLTARAADEVLDWLEQAGVPLRGRIAA